MFILFFNVIYVCLGSSTSLSRLIADISFQLLIARLDHRILQPFEKAAACTLRLLHGYSERFAIA
jgi:hypothetical protein